MGDAPRSGSSGSGSGGPSSSSLTVGTVVKLQNLQNAAHLNDSAGTVAQILPNGRYAIELFGDHPPTNSNSKQLSLKRENLRVIKTSSSAAVSLENDRASCLGCYKILPADQLQKCAKCRLVQYCSKKCQIDHWRAEHKDDCKLLRSARKAKDDEEKLPADRGDRIFARQQRGGRYIEQGRLDLAEKEFRTLLEVENAHWVVHYVNLAGVLLSQQKTKEALDVLRKAVACDVVGSAEFVANENICKARAYQQMADILFSAENDIPGAKDAYQKALELDPRDVHSWKRLALILRIQGDVADSDNAMRKATELEGSQQMSSLANGTEVNMSVRL